MLMSRKTNDQSQDFGFSYYTAFKFWFIFGFNHIPSEHLGEYGTSSKGSFCYS